MTLLVPATTYLLLSPHYQYPNEPYLWISEGPIFPEDATVIFHPNLVKSATEPVTRGDGTAIKEIYDAFIVALQMQNGNGETPCQLKDIKKLLEAEGVSAEDGVAELVKAVADGNEEGEERCGVM